MPRRPDFYCFFYCAVRGGQRLSVPERYAMGWRPAVAGRSTTSLRSLVRGLSGPFGVP